MTHSLILEFEVSGYLKIEMLLTILLQCMNNGINYNRAVNGDTNNVELLEIFFSGYPRMIGLNYFTHLKKLIIMNQQLQRIDGLMSLNKLTELWLCECSLKVGSKKKNLLIRG